ncbi:MAG: hypothetical protein AB4352_07620 [Hormoscilla sp.]
MKHDNRLPASIRYSLARLRPLMSPGFWGSTAMLLLAVLAVWEVGKNPDAIRSWLQNSDSSDVELELLADEEIEGDSITATSELSAAERAMAEVDELERLIKELDINITVNPEKPQSKSRASSRQKPSGTSSLTLDPQFQDQLVSTDELTYPGVAEGTTDASKLPDTGFYNPEMSIDRTKPKDRNLPVHPLKSALERRLSTNSTPGRSQTPVLPKPEVRPDQLRPSAYGAIVPSQSDSKQLRPSAYGTKLRPQSPSTSDQLRPSAYGAIAPEVLPSPSAVGRPETPGPSTYTPVPIDSYNYVMQTPPGGGPAVPYLIAPVGRPGLIPQPGLPNPNPGVANNLYNQPQQQPLTTPASLSNSTQEQTNRRDGDPFDWFFNP